MSSSPAMAGWRSRRCGSARPPRRRTPITASGWWRVPARLEHRGHRLERAHDRRARRRRRRRRAACRGASRRTPTGRSPASGVTAHRLPAPSRRTSRPMPSAVRRNHSCASASSGVQATRFQPVGVRPMSASSANQLRNRCRDTAGIGVWKDTRVTPAALRLPGFVNAHSHAFQRALRGVVERVDRGPPARRLLDLARGDVRRRRAARPRLGPRRRAARLPRDGRRRICRRGRVPLRPPPPRRLAVLAPERDGARDRRRRRRGRHRRRCCS